jgi:hypothetical protein
MDKSEESMKSRMLLACLVLGFGSAVWTGCQNDRVADPFGVGSTEDATLDKTGTASGGDVSANFGVGAVAKVHAETSGCSNNPGPYIKLNGEITLGGVNAKLVFSNNMKYTHTHEEDVVVDIVLLPEGESITFAKQPPLGGVGGNPWIYLAFTNGEGEYYGKPQLLGRCVQGLFSAARRMNIPSGAKAVVGTGGCSNKGGPTITLDGELAIGGLSAELIFTNNRKFRHVKSEDIVVGVVIIPTGESIEFAKAPPLDGAGGNPHIFLQFETGKGSPLSDMFYLGRCVQLGN